MSDKLKQFEEKVKNADDAPLIDSLIDHAKKADSGLDYYEATKIIKKELLARLNKGVM